MPRRDPGREENAPGGAPDDARTGRLPYLDNLKVILIAAIIAVHAILGYVGVVEVWTYSEFREVTLSPVIQGALLLTAMPFALFMIALLFLVAGLLTVPSVERKGPGRFAGDRLVRLGIPFVVYVLVIQPAVVYALAHPLGAAPGTFWEEFLGEKGILDTGPLWFVGVLLVYSLAYAAWVALRGQRPSVTSAAITVPRLWLVAILIGPLAFLIRLAYPYGSDSGFTDLNFWQWPACIAVFVLGLAASRQGWLTEVPAALIRTSRVITLAAATAMACLLFGAGLTDRVEDLLGGWHWLAAGFAVLDGVLNVFGSVWLLSVAQRRLTRPLPGGVALSRSAYGAFILQTPILIGLALVMRPVGVPAVVKAIVVVVGGVAGSFGVAWLLISRVPGVARVL